MGNALNGPGWARTVGGERVEQRLPHEVRGAEEDPGGLRGPHVLAGHAARVRAEAEARTVLGWPKNCKLAHAFLRECSCQRLKLAQLLGRHDVSLT
jgi:hypothetical protein